MTCPHSNSQYLNIILNQYPSIVFLPADTYQFAFSMFPAVPELRFCLIVIASLGWVNP